MSVRIVYGLIGFIAGLLFGSFLNVCISRLPRHESIVRPGSRCPRCKAPIRWHDNIPVLSWLLLRGRCRDCREQISWRYPTVEMVTALWLAIQAMRLHTVIHFFGSDIAQSGIGSAPYAILANLAITVAGVLLMGLIFMDWETGTLPDSFTWTGIFLGILFVCLQAFFLLPGEGQLLVPGNAPKLTSAGETQLAGNVLMTGPEAMILGRILAVCGAALLLFLMGRTYKAIRHRDGMGGGDIKLLAMITAFLGFWPGMLSMFLGVLGAGVYSVYLIMRGRANGASRIPFGSFLGAGALISAQVGDRILDAYLRLFR